MFGMKHSMSSDMQQCMEDCHQCHLMCLQMAATHCLEMGGRHTEPAHMRLMLDCAEICQTAMNFMARHSAHHAVTGSFRAVSSTWRASAAVRGMSRTSKSARSRPSR